MGWGVVPTTSLLAGNSPNGAPAPCLPDSIPPAPSPSQLLQGPRRQVVISGWKLLACGEGHSVIIVSNYSQVTVFQMTCLYTNLSRYRTQITQSFPKVLGGIR